MLKHFLFDMLIAYTFKLHPDTCMVNIKSMTFISTNNLMNYIEQTNRKNKNKKIQSLFIEKFTKNEKRKKRQIKLINVCKFYLNVFLKRVAPWFFSSPFLFLNIVLWLVFAYFSLPNETVC